MNISLETAALTPPVRNETENNKMKYSCPQWDSNPGPSAYEYPLSVALLVEISIVRLNTDRVLPECTTVNMVIFAGGKVLRK